LNWQHLTAFLWLRWRLLANQWRRGGTLNAVLMMIVTVVALVMAVPLFVLTFVLGLYAIPKAEPVHLLFAWDGVVAGFVFFWMIGLITELQRTEPLSLSKFLHLPVSVNGAFLINYVSSLVRLSLVIFVPLMIGFCLALIVTKGVLLLSALPLLAGFLLMVTALTYQFQGWLASLMSNPRRRRSVIVAATVLFVLIAQLPSMLNFLGVWGGRPRGPGSGTFAEELAKIDHALQAHEIDAAEHLRRRQELVQKQQLAAKQAERDDLESLQQTARILNLAVPAGWLPLGIMGASEGRLLPAVLGFLGMTLIGTASLWRAYRTTIRLYQGQFTSRKVRKTPSAAAAAGAHKSSARLLEMRLRGLTEPVSAIALGGLSSLLRSPEAKMMLLTPLVLGGVFGSLLIKAPQNIPESMRPLLGMSGMLVVLFGIVQVMANQFGFDRDGFRVFVLCAAPRRDILLGKNLAFAPLTLGMAAIMLIVVQFLCPMRLDHLLSMLPQYASMYLLFCVLMNLISIYAPMHIAAGSLKPANAKLVPVLIQMFVILLFFPLTQAPTFLPLAIEAALRSLGWVSTAPICLLLSLAECAGVVLLYRISLSWEGGLLQSREQKILEAVTHKAV